MDPVNEHDPTMDANLVHAVNVNNKKGEVEMKFLTRSITNARHVQENIYRQEEKDLIRQLWRLHQEKARRHPDVYHQTMTSSGNDLQRLPSDLLEVTSLRRDSFSRLGDQSHHVTTLPSSRVRLDGKYSGHSQAGKTLPHRAAHQTKAAHDSESSSHHFSPGLLVHHRQPECYPQASITHRRHGTGGYQPPEGVPGISALPSSHFNAVVQPAGYGHSVTEHAARLGMHKHYHRGLPSHGSHQPHPPHPTHHPPKDSVQQTVSYESLTRYITLLDYQASEESKKTGRPSKKHSKTGRGTGLDQATRSQHRRGTSEDRKTGRGTGRETSGDAKTRVPKDETSSSGADKPTKTEKPRPRSTAQEKVLHIDDIASKTDTTKGKQDLSDAGVELDTTKRSHSRGVAESGREIEIEDSHGKVIPSESSRHQYGCISWHPSSYIGMHSPQASSTVTSTTATNKPTSSSTYTVVAPYNQHGQHHHHHHHHHHYLASKSDLQHHQQQQQQQQPSWKDSSHRYHQQHSQVQPKTAAERKRLAIQLLASEYPVLLRHAPTKFDPLEALMSRYLRLSSTNVETLQDMCKEAGVEVGAHAHQQIDDVNDFVFKNEKPNC